MTDPRKKGKVDLYGRQCEKRGSRQKGEVLDGQQAPFPAITAFGVCSKIFRSSQGEQLRA